MRIPHAHKERLKFPFLKNLTTLGSITLAARKTRLSRQTIHRWLSDDATFRRAYNHAKHQYDNQAFLGLESALVFFASVVRPLIPVECWPRVASEIAIAMSNLKNDLKGGRRKAVPLSGEVTEVSLSPNRFEGVAILNRDRENSGHDL